MCHAATVGLGALIALLTIIAASPWGAVATANPEWTNPGRDVVLATVGWLFLVVILVVVVFPPRDQLLHDSDQSRHAH